MKQVIVFAVIMMLFGSLKMPERKKCPEKVKTTLYNKGRYVGEDVLTNSRIKYGINFQLCNGKTVFADSAIYRVTD
jgi:hypothetical protein